MGGKSKKGGAEKAVVKEEKKKKQEAKSQKKAEKKAKKGGKGGGGGLDSDEEDLEAILAELRLKDADRAAVSVENNCAPPPPRSNFSLCPLDNSSELLLFGGELYDGNTSDCYNDLYRLNLEKMEWRKISSPNTPDPRNAHQAICVRDNVYLFGGEFSRGFQFQHYRDLWKLDLIKNAWTQIETKTGPSPRSGHRMTLWKHYLVLFGGFYETSRGVKFYDDLYFFDLREEKWHLAVSKSSNAQKPSARSGFQFVCNTGKNIIYVYGGYSKVTVSAVTERGRNLDDMWALHLALPAKAGECPTFRWEAVPKKGQAPTRRSGAACCVHKNRMILFGGVLDTETSNDVLGEFYNTLHGFDMDREKWFMLSVAPKKSKDATSKKKKKRGNEAGSQASQLDNCEDVQDDEEGDDDDDDEEGHAPEENDGDNYGLDDNAFYVYINGVLTKIDYEEDDDKVEQGEEHENAQPKKEADKVQAAKSVEPAHKVDPAQQAEQPNSKQDAVDEQEMLETATVSSAMPEAVVDSPPPAAPAPACSIVAPRGRIGAGLSVLGNRLFVYGGTTDEGEQQVTFDDLWCVDLNQMDEWLCLKEGTWRSQEWKGDDKDLEEDEDDEGADMDREAGSASDEDESEEEEPDEEKLKIEALSQKARLGRVAKLREKLQVSDDARTPRPREPLREFFKRTLEVWIKEAFAQSEADARYSGKELRKVAFKNAEARFKELFPLLVELDALEEEQRLQEEMQEQEKQRRMDKMREKAKSRKAHMDKVNKHAKKSSSQGELDEDESEDSD